MPRKSGSASGSGGGKSGAPRKKSWSGGSSAKGAKGNPFGAKKSLGQHFLRDHGVADAIVAAANLSKTDTVLEIGPGPGVLTGRLVEQAGRVFAVELDDRFAAALLARYADNPHVTIIHDDILEVDPAIVVGRASTPDLPADALTSPQTHAQIEKSGVEARLTTPHPGPLLKEREKDVPADAQVALHPLLQERAGVRWKTVANIPYYITSPILRHLLEAPTPPELAVIMVQKEVAERICAQPGDLSLLAISVQHYATPELILTVPAAAFQPPPKVDSAVVRLTPHASPLFPHLSTERYFDVVRAGFSQKRKQVANSLSAGLQLPKGEVVAWLGAAGIDSERRAETLTLGEWAKLIEHIDIDVM